MYAEYLPKLQKISIVISLPTPSEWKTKILIGEDANTLHVYHETISTKMALPVNSSIRDEQLGFGSSEISPGHTKLSWRIKPADSVIKAAEAMAKTGAEVVRVPWSAADLNVEVDVVCRKCRSVILTKEKLKQWKDLPSENWAEMMEFWHCHKPITANGDKEDYGDTDSHTDGPASSKASDDPLASRGYGANMAITAQSGVGFVDLTNFLFYGQDCRGLMVSNTRPWAHFLVDIPTEVLSNGYQEGHQAESLRISTMPKCIDTNAQEEAFRSSCLVQATEELTNPRLDGVACLF